MSRHLDYWSNLERSNCTLWLGFWAMTGLALLEAWGLGQPRPVHIVPGAVAPSLSRPGVGLELVAQDYAQRYALTVGNFTPDTARRAYELALPYLTPEAASEWRVRMEEEFHRIEREKITSQFALSGEVTVQADAGVLVTTVPGRKKVYAGKTLLTDAPSVYRVLVVAAPVSDANPYGVQIAGGSSAEPATQRAEHGGAT
jgi:hypothetical protein